MEWFMKPLPNRGVREILGGVCVSAYLHDAAEEKRPFFLWVVGCQKAA